MAPKARISGPPSGRRSFANGVGTLNRLLSLTLGPHAGKILVENNGSRQANEHLDDAFALSQRVLDLPDCFEDMGSQVLRKALTAIGTRSHDGAATCSAIAHAILRAAEPVLMSGYDAHRFALEVTATKAQIIAELNKYSELIHSMEEIEAVLRSALVDPILAKVVAEILDTVGPEGAVKVEETRLPDLAHEYVRGGRWTTKIASPYLLDSTETVVTLHDPLIAVSTAPLVNVDGIILALEAATATKSRNLILLAPKFSDQVISALLLNRERGVLNVALAVLVPTSAHFGEEILVDIGMLVGAGFDVLNAPHASGSIRTEALGGAAEVWASRSAFGVIEGKGGPQALSARIRTLRNQIAVEENAVKRRQLRERIGTLQGIGAIIRAPSRTASFRDDRVTKVEKAIAIARQALQQGVLPGGGAALAHCAAELGSSEPQPIGSRVLLQAISEPMSVILENSDYHPGPILDQLSSKNWHDAFDVTSGVWVDTREAGLLDTLVSTKVALETAVSVALMVISTDTLVSRKAAQHYPRPRKARA